ncbi:XRE family transcriptional regulator [Oceanobacillus piezotolerans]|uniref:XRE family transcriptional regulator n=1 Tax=Oceanobacillus piezotolerans TaxID=2448030 RepID=A0A498DGY3_9BACI|nr:helix-turn-helix transcriptional regulator [Oceanobacillus piezotolerans]RLL47749.1 XRE family transcriptional regulator [Oceanobacillus piezotolerans]
MGVFPIETLGERIRTIRKEKKMTLEELAGDRLSKGMLSLIENNKAKPSMESLTFISERLGVHTAELLSENQTGLRNLLDQAERLFHQDSEYYQVEQVEQKYTDIGNLIQPHVDKLYDGYEAARLLEIYSKSLFYANKEGWEESLQRAQTIYEALNITARRASIGIFQATVHFADKKYEQALQVLLEEKQKTVSQEPYLDPLTRLDFDYHEAIFRMAVGDTERALEVIEEAIDYSKEHKIFYRIDDLFRISAGYGLLFHDEEKIHYYQTKLLHYAELADDPFYYAFSDLHTAELLIAKEDKYEEALNLMEKHIQSKKFDAAEPHFMVVKGKALYGLGRYKEAIDCLEKVGVPYYLHHPYDLSLIYIADSYKALCLMAVGEEDAALRCATLARENFSPLIDTFYKDFANLTYRKIVEEIKEKSSKRKN